MLSMTLLGSVSLFGKSIDEIDTKYKRLDDRNILYLNGLDLSTVAGLNEIEKIEDLKVLNLSENELTTLPEEIFRKLSNLEELDLSDNYLSTLPDDMFDNLTNLKYLYLGNNKFNKIEVRNIEKKAKEKGIELRIEEQDPEPIHLEPNISPDEYAQMSPEEREDECAICSQEIEEDIYKTACPPKGHWYHAECLSHWLRSSEATSCPMCRRDIFTGEEAERMPDDYFAHTSSKVTKGTIRVAQGREKKGRKIIAKNGKKKKHLHIAKHTRTSKHTLA
jgi:hypothetical protein